MLVKLYNHTLPVMKNYFVVLRLPASGQSANEAHSDPHNFWSKAKNDLENHRCEVVSIRRDTGISEELRSHLANLSGFTTYLIFHARLTDEQATDRDLLFDMAKTMIESAQKEVVDYNEHFQLVAIDHYEDGHAA